MVYCPLTQCKTVNVRALSKVAFFCFLLWVIHFVPFSFFSCTIILGANLPEIIFYLTQLSGSGLLGGLGKRFDTVTVST